MKKFTGLLALAVTFTLAPVAAYGSSSAPTDARYGTGSFAVSNVVLPVTGCISHWYVTTVHVGDETDSWYVDVTVYDPDGGIAGGFDREVSDDEPGATSIDDDVSLCAGVDDPGTYRVVGSLFTANNGSSSFVEQQLTASSFTVAAPAGATPTQVDVVGTVTSAQVARGVRLTFRTEPVPSGTVANKVRWTVLLDGKIRKTFSQDAADRRQLKVTSPARSGKHVVKVLRNGKPMKTVKYRA